MASAPIAEIVWMVSCRLSPFDTEEPLAEKLSTSAESRLAAASNDRRVRVESSKKRLTTVRPRSTGSFLTSRSDTRVISSAMSRMPRSEEHTSELQSRFDLVCRLLLAKNKHKPND